MRYVYRVREWDISIESESEICIKSERVRYVYRVREWNMYIEWEWDMYIELESEILI